MGGVDWPCGAELATAGQWEASDWPPGAELATTGQWEASDWPCGAELATAGQWEACTAPRLDVLAMLAALQSSVLLGGSIP
jgi:hypothetical protein